MRYLKQTAHYRLRLGGGDMILNGYSDSDFASSDLDGRRSISGYVFYFGGSVVSWASRLQRTVAQSTAESEYVAMAGACNEAIYLKQLLACMGFSVNAQIQLQVDNQAAQAIAENPVHIMYKLEHSNYNIAVHKK